MVDWFGEYDCIEQTSCQELVNNKLVCLMLGCCVLLLYDFVCVGVHCV